MTIAEVISLESNQLKFIFFCFKSSADVHEMTGAKKINKINVCGMCDSSVRQWCEQGRSLRGGRVTLTFFIGQLCSRHIEVLMEQCI